MIVFNGCSWTYGDELPGSRHPDGPEFDTHHHLTYAHHVSNLLGESPYINLAQNASSNDKIFRRTMQFLSDLRWKKETPELLVVQWSTLCRFEIVDPIEEEYSLYGVPWFVPKESSANQLIMGLRYGKKEERPKLVKVGWMNHRNPVFSDFMCHQYSVETLVLHTLSQMNVIQDYCDMAGIPLIQHHYSSMNYEYIIKSLDSRFEELKDYKDTVVKYLKNLRRASRIGLGNTEVPCFHRIAKQDKYKITDLGHFDEGAHKEFAEVLVRDVFPIIKTPKKWRVD